MEKKVCYALFFIIILPLMPVISLKEYDSNPRPHISSTNLYISSTQATQKYKIQWDVTFGGTEVEIGGLVIQAADGGFVLVGYTRSYGAGESDMWLVRTNAYGQQEWNATFGGSGIDAAWSAIQTVDGGYALAGDTLSYGAGESDMWLVKTNAYGQQEWNTPFGGSDKDTGKAVIQTTDGGFVLVGDTRSYGAGESDMWLVKTDTHGNHEWNTTFGGPKRDTGRSIIQTTDGGFALVGYTRSFGAGESDMWLVKTDVHGNHEWNTTFGGPKGDTGWSVIQIADGGYALVGDISSYAAGESDIWLVKTDANGIQEWNKTFGGPGIDAAWSLIQTTDWGFVLAGHTSSYGAGSIDMWLLKTDARGQHKWSTPFGGTGDDYGYSVIQTADGGFALAGYTSSYGAGVADIWLIKTIEYEDTTTPGFEIILGILPIFSLLIYIERKKLVCLDSGN
ncbi:MAG: hypothetical protein ACFFAE_11360 [Candidatus Hodarchaeota archaeon]